MPNSISTLGQQLSLVNRVKSMQMQMSQYQQQISTGVKYQNFKEYGADAMRIQRYRADLVDLKGFMYNIDIASINIEQMDAAIQETIEQAGNVLSAINTQLSQGSDYDLDSIKNAAKTALQLVQANMNSKIGDRYLFAGTDVSNQPYTGAAIATTNLQARISDWLDGTTTTENLMPGIKGMTDSQLGYSGTLSSAKRVYANADVGFEVDYTVFANDEGFKKVVAGLNALANMEEPVDGVDAPTKAQFHEVIDALYKYVQEGVEGLRSAASQISSASGTLGTVKKNHENDQQSALKLLEKTEGTDVTEAAIRFQALQNQLDASYRVTAIMSQLTLSNYVNFG